MDEEQATIFQRGSDVGLLAQQLFPGGINVAPPTPFDYPQSVADTSRCIREGHKVIYEAAFQFDGILCAIDILVNRNGRWFAYEVKSAARVKPPFIRDAALQYYVMTQSGLLLEDIFVTHINRQYIRHGELDLNRLFNSVSVKKDTQELQPFIVARIEELKAVLQLSIAPVIEMGDQCSKPYPCDFRGFCSKDQPEDEPEEAYIDHDAIYEFLDSLRYPLYFMSSKLTFTKLAAGLGIKVVYCGVQDNDSFIRALKGEAGTTFKARSSTLNERQKWLASGSITIGSIEIDEGAYKALQQRKSLLLVGVTKIEGAFSAGEVVQLTIPSGEIVGVARMRFSASDLTVKIKNRMVAHDTHRG